MKRWTIRVCKHDQVVTFANSHDWKPLHVWEPGGGDCDDTATNVAFVEVAPASEVERLQDFARWAMDTRDAEGIPASYEDIYDRARAALDD